MAWRPGRQKLDARAGTCSKLERVLKRILQMCTQFDLHDFLCCPSCQHLAGSSVSHTGITMGKLACVRKTTEQCILSPLHLACVITSVRVCDEYHMCQYGKWRHSCSTQILPREDVAESDKRLCWYTRRRQRLPRCRVYIDDEEQPLSRCCLAHLHDHGVVRCGAGRWANRCFEMVTSQNRSAA